MNTACMDLTGYTDRVSVRAGQKIEVKVSCSLGGSYHADLVRMFSVDPNPAGPGIDVRHVPSAFEGGYPSTFKGSTPGSYGKIALQGLTDVDDVTLSVRAQPRLVGDNFQCLFEVGSDEGHSLAVGFDRHGIAILADRTRHASSFVPEAGRWLELRLSWRLGVLHLGCYDVFTGSTLALIRIQSNWRPCGLKRLLLASLSAPENDLPASFFNGRMEGPRLLRGEQMPDALGPATDASVIAHWDFGRDIPSDRITDVGKYALSGKLYNLPTRGVRGSNWSGREMCWRHAPEEYGAIHFHEDDVYDCGWSTDFVFEPPADLPSGVYGVRLRCRDAEDIIPFFLRPPKVAKRRLAVLFSTLTYQAYSNYPRTNFDASYVSRQNAWRSNPNHPARFSVYGRSLYDVHADRSGVMFSSLLRPQLLTRPGLFAYIDEKGSGLRHFPADMHLIAWLEGKGIEADVVTDHDLEAEGIEALEGYDVLLTVTHPEYHTSRTLNALHGFVDEGGSFGYLGGNGFYWRVATSAEYPGAIEIRRNESGVRMWETEPGEAYHSFDGQYGGLWTKNDRPPQRLVGIGMSAQGSFTSSFYRRTEASRAPEVAWLFDGIEGDILGDFGFSGGGAAGFELDAVDPQLGTPESAVVLASSEGHGADYACVPENVWNPDLHSPEWQKAQIRADMTLVPMPKGNFVFSTGSIMFCGSLPANGFDNNISRLLSNFVAGCVRKEEH